MLKCSSILGISHISVSVYCTDTVNLASSCYTASCNCVSVSLPSGLQLNTAKNVHANVGNRRFTYNQLRYACRKHTFKNHTFHPVACACAAAVRSCLLHSRPNQAPFERLSPRQHHKSRHLLIMAQVKLCTVVSALSSSLVTCSSSVQNRSACSQAAPAMAKQKGSSDTIPTQAALDAALTTNFSPEQVTP